MNSRYKQLVEELGEAGAKAEMSRVSKLNRKPRGFATMDKDKLKAISSRGGKSSHNSDGQNSAQEASTPSR